MIEQPGATLPLVTIFGPPGSALGYAIRDFLYRSDVPFEWVQLTTDALQLTGDLDGPALTHLDGAQRVPSTNKRGWTYDFKTHTTNSLGCDS